MKKTIILFALLANACAKGPPEPDREWLCRTTWTEDDGEAVKFTAFTPVGVDPEVDEVKDIKGWYRDPARTEACISRDAPEAKVKPKTKV